MRIAFGVPYFIERRIEKIVHNGYRTYISFTRLILDEWPLGTNLMYRGKAFFQPVAG